MDRDAWEKLAPGLVVESTIATAAFGLGVHIDSKVNDMSLFFEHAPVLSVGKVESMSLRTPPFPSFPSCTCAGQGDP